MAQPLPNDSTLAKRTMGLWLYEDDGVTPAPTSTIYQGQAAYRALLGCTATLSGVTLTWNAIGTPGNSVSIQLSNTGSGAGSLTNTGSAYTFAFQAGVTTVANMIAAMSGVFAVSGSYTGSNTLASGDATPVLTLAGGIANCLFYRQNGVASAGWVAADGTLTNGMPGAASGIAGDFVYQATQASLNFTGSEFALRVSPSPTPASLALSTKTTHVNTIVYDKVAVGAAGNATTIAFVADGSGSGTLNESAYPTIVFHYAPGTTTVANFEAAVVASTHLGVQQYGTWSNVIQSGDAFSATDLAGGLSYMQQGFTFDMRWGSFDNVGSNTRAYGDVMRLIEAVIAGLVTNFTSNTLAFQNPDGTKTRATYTEGTTGRTAVTIGDLTP